jgi:uncharacterized protein YcfL
MKRNINHLKIALVALVAQSSEDEALRMRNCCVSFAQTIPIKNINATRAMEVQDRCKTKPKYGG